LIGVHFLKVFQISVRPEPK